jgi:hypothetical protein
MNSLDLVSQKSAEQANEHPADIGWRQYCEEHISALEQWKLRNNLSTGNVAVLLGLSPKTVANWLARKSAPVSTPTWKKIVVISRLPLLMLTLAFAADCVNATTPSPVAHLNDAFFKHSIKKPAHSHIAVDPFQVMARKY